MGRVRVLYSTGARQLLYEVMTCRLKGMWLECAPSVRALTDDLRCECTAYE